MEPDPQNSGPRRVEAYLDQVLAPLTRRLSEFHRQELRRELRTHLWGRIDAYRELGRSESDAVTEALRQFGGADDFVQQWQGDWVTNERHSAGRELAAATWSALYISVPTLLGTWVLARLLAFAVINCLPSTYVGSLIIVYSDALLAIMGAGFFILSLWAGSIHGRRAPRRSGQGMFGALGAMIAAGSAFYWIGTRIGLDRTVFGDVLASLPLMAAAWMPTACFAAALSGWVTRRRKGAIA